jgi:hypothetical protein
MEMQRLTDGTLPRLAWPGLYPLAYLDGQNSVLCADCANASDHDEELPQFRPVAQFANWENNALFCDNCGVRIESAYGEED